MALKIRSPLHRVNGETRATVNWPSADLDVWFSDSGYQTSVAGVDVTADTALKHAAYWRAINLLSSQVANFPLSLYRRQPNGDTVEITDHPSINLLTLQPNNVSDHFIWRESMQANVLTWGNGYSKILRGKGGMPLELIILDSKQVQPRTDGRAILYEIRGKKGIDPNEVLHIKGLCFDGAEGKAPIQAAAESLGVGLAMQKYSANLFKNGAKQTGVLTHPMALSTKARDGMRKSFEEKIKGPEGGTMILDEGMKWQATGIPPDQAQLLQSKQFSIQDVARWFGIPPFLLFEESRSTFTNISDQGMSFVRYTLNQWVGRWEAELGKKLLKEDERKDHYFKFNMDSLMRGNAKDRFESYRAGLDMGVYSINEVRKLEELNKIEGGDKHLVQMNREPLNNMSDGKETV
jgi:HK97 family phage portal protein